MKKNKHLLIVIATLLCSLTVNAKSEQIEGIWYNLDSKTNQAQVTRTTDQTKPRYKGDVVIPSTVTFEGVIYDVTEIGDYAFFSCVDLASVIIPESVIKIGAGAFEECRNLPAISLPKHLKNIEKYAFAGCSSLGSITIPADVLWIGEGSFWDCRGLKTLVIEDASEVLCLGANFENKISEGMFYDCPLETIYLGRDLSYPESEQYGYSPFYNKNKLTSFTFGDEVTVIGENLLFNCSSVASVTIPESVAEIGKSAFMYCGSLTSIIIPAGVNTLNESTFEGCESLSSVTIPSSVARINSGAFFGCSKLASVHIASIEEWCKIDFESSSANPLSYAKKFYLNDVPVTEVAVPSNITEIKDYAFYNYCEELAVVDIPEGVTEIGDSAFYNCSSLTSINVPSSVELIGRNVFENCRGQLTVDCDVPSAISASEGAFHKAAFSEVLVTDKVEKIGSYAFFDCGNLKYVSIAENVDSIGVGAFAGCTGELLLSCNVPSLLSAKESGFYGSKFSDVIMDDKVREIGDYAFYGLETLDSVTIAENVVKVGKNAFGKCTGTLSFECNVPSATSAEDGAFYKSAFSKVVVGEKADSIGDYAFSDCEALASIVIPSSFKSVGTDAFKGCKKLVDVHIGDLQSWLTIKCENKDSRPNSQAKTKLYQDGEVLSKVEVPAAVGSIPDYAFYNCTLDSVVLPQTVKAIGNGAFEKCTGKLAVNCNIPSGSKAADGAFYGSSFEKVIVGELVDTIGSFAFANCGALTAISLPEGLDTIGADAFKNSKKLVDIHLNSVESWLSIRCGNKDSRPNTQSDKANLYVGETLIAKMDIPSTIVAIPDYAFFNCNFESVTIHENVVAFGNSVFENCSGKLVVNCNLPAASAATAGAFYKSMFTDVAFGDRVASIGDYAFSNCAKMNSVVIPFGVSSIGKGAFEGCTGVLTVNNNIPSASEASKGAFYKSGFSELLIGSQVDSIGSYAFADCGSLAAVNIPASVDSIGADAFKNCNKLVDVYVEDLESWLSIKCGNKDSRPNSQNSKSKLYVDSVLLTDVVLPETVDSISAYAFCNYVDLRTVVVPAAVSAVGNDAFNGCTSLYKVFNYSNLPLEEGSKNYGYVAYYAKSVVELDKVDLKGDFQFQTIEGEHYLVNYVGEKSEVVLPTDYNGDSYQIAAAALYNCDSVKAITVPAGVKAIGEGAFNGCDNLASISIAKDVVSIEADAFKGCGKLSELYVETLESWLEVECGNKSSRPNSNGKTKLYIAGEMLKEVEIPAGITSIPDNAFCNCDSITSVIIPAEVEAIGAGAFAGCTTIASIVCNAEEAPVCGAKAFDGVEKSIPVYVLTDVAVYAEAEGWKEFTNIIGKDTSVEMPEAENENQPTVIYDLQGRRVQNAENMKGGLYIVNGRKVMIK